MFLIPDDKRINVKWATFSQVQAELNLINAAYYNNVYDYFWLVSGQDYPLATPEKIIERLAINPQIIYMNLSYSKNNGNTTNTHLDKRHEILFPDWILKKGFVHRIVRRLWVEFTGGYNHTYKIFKRHDTLQYKYYYGSQWWCISRNFVEHILSVLIDNPQLVESFNYSSCPDESFFQTILMNSDFKKYRMDYLHYIDWGRNNNSPRILTRRDLVH